MPWFTAALLSAALLTACAQDTPMTNQESALMAVSGQQVPFHSDVAFQTVQVPIPAERCTATLPSGMSYLWLTRLTGTAVSTHLGTGRIEGFICIYGQLTDPQTEPPGNGIPVGWADGRIAFTAANGDLLLATIASSGMTGVPGTPEWRFTEAGHFLDGGTGRFQHAQGEITGNVDPVAGNATYDGWIRYGRK